MCMCSTCTHTHFSVYYCCSRTVNICQFEKGKYVYAFSNPYHTISSRLFGWNKALKTYPKRIRTSVIYHGWKKSHNITTYRLWNQLNNSVSYNGSSKIPTTNNSNVSLSDLSIDLNQIFCSSFFLATILIWKNKQIVILSDSPLMLFCAYLLIRCV